MVPTRIRVRALHAQAAFFILFILIVPIARAQDKDWRPVTPAELQMKTGQVEPDADAEAIFWDTWVDDRSGSNLTQQHYVRVKILTERGREKYSKFDIPFVKGVKIKDLAARVIKVDGSIVEVGKDDIIEREIVRANGLKLKAKTFAVPGIEPGVIVEYRYSEAISDASASGMHLEFQRDIPVQALTYYYRPYSGKEPATQSYNLPDIKFEKDKSGFYVAKRTNVPAFREEPKMPPEDSVRGWMLVTGPGLSFAAFPGYRTAMYAMKSDGGRKKDYWSSVAGDYTGFAKIMTKPDRDIKAAAMKVTAGAQTDDEKLRKLYEFCQTQISNTTYDPSLTEEQRRKPPEFKSIADILKIKASNSHFIDILFGSMASSLGFEVGLGFSADRSEMFFEPSMNNQEMLRQLVVGIKVGDNWKFFDPGMRFLPYGMLVWYEEDTYGLLVTDKEQYGWVNTTITPYESSQVKRTGKFDLNEDGTLTGEVTMEYSGQPALTDRLSNFDEGREKQEETFRNEIKANMATAEVSGISIENLLDPSKPLIKRYKVRVPNYAQRTGKRIFLQPGYFEYGVPPLFSASTRKYDVFFHYPWSENDSVEITFPKNFDLDNADAPGVISDPQRVGRLNIDIQVNKATSTLIYKRQFYFGNGGNTVFKAAAYQPLKTLFDTFQSADRHTITLKQK